MEPVPRQSVEAMCRQEGLAHIAAIPVPGALAPDGLDRLLADGVGDMRWLAENRAVRLAATGILPTARSLLCVAWHYSRGAGGEGGLRRAAYAAGKDYHTLLRPKLGRIALALSRHGGGAWRHRACVDSAPLNERTLARLAGLGWIGRNALLISPHTGSFRLLGFLLTEAQLQPFQAGLEANRCGSCHRCETTCPTGALVAGRCLTTRCISYLTIEHQGVIPRQLAERFGGWWFGCDVCQDVCPWNRFAPPGEDRRLAGADRAAELLALTAAGFDAHFAGRAVRRLTWAGFRRNLLVALWSLGRQQDLAPILAEGLPLVCAQADELGLHRAGITA